MSTKQRQKLEINGSKEKLEDLVLILTKLLSLLNILFFSIEVIILFLLIKPIVKNATKINIQINDEHPYEERGM